MGLNIAIIGTRGVPNYYGGFEHFAAHLSRGLVQKGHEVTVYNSSNHPFKGNDWHGVRIVHRFDPERWIGMAGQFIYDLNCLLHARQENYDIILMLGYTSSSIWKFLFPDQSIIVTNMDGLEWQRSKYSSRVRRFLKYAERLAISSCKFHVADSPVIKKYLDEKYNINCKYISYGADLRQESDPEVLEEYGLKKFGYYLLMARMEPENNIDMVLEGVSSSDSETIFVVIGDISGKYGRAMYKKYRKCKQIIFTGALFDERKVHSLVSFCRLYFHGHSAGGTNPSLLDAMAAQVPIMAHDNAFNRSVLKNNAVFFTDAEDLSCLIHSEYPGDVEVQNNYANIVGNFQWQMIIDQYETYFIECFIVTHGYYHIRQSNIAAKHKMNRKVVY